MGETELEMIQRHIREGDAIVARQTDLVARLTRDGLPFQTAITLLWEFRLTLQQHRDHLARYRKNHS